MARTAKVIGISVPPAIRDEIEKISKEEGKSKSQLVRDMFELYKKEKMKSEFLSLQKEMSQKAASKGVFTEADIEKLVFEGR